MSRETEFVRIKRAVEQEKTKKLQGEAKMESLKQEEIRIINEVKELTAKEMTSPEEVEAYTIEMKESIEKQILEMKSILDGEGVSY